MYKFNSGRGGVICDQCRVLIDQDLGLIEYEETYGKENSDGDFCMKCKGLLGKNKESNDVMDDGWRN